VIDLQGKIPKLLVIGDLMIDNYLWGSCERISPEAPVQIVNINRENSLLGGAGNVVNNLNALGAEVNVISVIGSCKTSGELKSLLTQIQVNTDHLIIQKNRIISKKSRVIASQQQVVRFDQESTEDISKSSSDQILKLFKQLIKDCDCVLLSDYGKGVLTYDLTRSLINIAKDNKKKVLVDPKGKNYSKYKGSFLLTPNKKEASEATKINIKDNNFIEKAILKLKKDYELDISLITLSEEGVAIFDDSLRNHPTAAREVFDVTGAGDTMLAALGFATACKYSIDDAVKFSNLAAGIVVGKIGSATATFNEIIEYDLIAKKYSDQYIKTLDEISSITKELKIKDKKIVFTNGCFDLLHSGHVRYLEIAKSFGDILILGLNSDRSVSSIKGDNRPINSENDRAYILAGLQAVDFVVVFDEDTPYELIKSIKPHILVKGADYEGKEVVGQNIAEELKLVKFIDGKSTTEIIDKIQKRN
jgi:D-beta-D-heptose 7-phosphate kinase / D-beta-D-heptose 1-phosphate adenosyltransferase